MTLADLDLLEEQALSARSATVPHVYFAVLVPGDTLLKLIDTQRFLVRLRAHKGRDHVANTMRADRHEWAYNERTGENEDFEGEAKQCREAYDLALALMGEEPWADPEAKPSEEP